MFVGFCYAVALEMSFWVSITSQDKLVEALEKRHPKENQGFLEIALAKKSHTE